MDNEFRSQIEEQFYRYLLRRGYPPNAIVFEARLSDRFRPGFAINDPERDQRLAYFEVKGAISRANQHEMFEQIKAYADAARGIPVYLATPARSPTFEEPFDFYFVDKENQVQVFPKELFPTFRSLASDAVASRKEKVEESRETTKDFLQWACWILAVLTVILGVADFFFERTGVELISGTRLTLFGVAIALVIIPFAQKLKILGVEYERLSRPSDRKPKS